MWNDNASNIDILFYEPYANVVLNILNDIDKTPLTIGLFGSWGAGKSSMLNFIDDKISKNTKENKICSIKINAWLLEGYDDAKLGIIETVLEAIKDNRTFFQTVKDGVVNLIKKVNWLKIAKIVGKTGVSIGLSALSGNPLPAIASVASTITDNLTNEINNNGEEFINDNVQNNQTVEKNIREIRDDFEDLLTKSPIDNLVVMIDDLDRCSPDRIMEVLEAVKLFLSVKKTTFIFAVDESIVRYSIKKKYVGDEDFAYEDIAKDYIEKVIQIPIIIPSLSQKDIENYLLLLYYQSKMADSDFCKMMDIIKEQKALINSRPIEADYLDSIIRDNKIVILGKKSTFERTKSTICNVKSTVSTSLKGNPRQAKRFLNAFFIKRELASYYFDDMNESILAKLMALYVIDEKAFRDLYEWNKDYNGTIPELESLEINKQFDKHGNWNNEPLKKWLETEPTELYKQDLNKYFYLTKEYLSNVGSRGLTNEEREIIDTIVNGEPLAIDSYLKQLKSNGKTLDNIINLVLKHFKNKRIDINVIASIFEFFQQYRPLIKEMFSNIGGDCITIGSLPAIKRMIKSDNELIETIVNNDSIDAKIKERLKG